MNLNEQRLSKSHFNCERGVDRVRFICDKTVDHQVKSGALNATSLVINEKSKRRDSTREI